MVLSFTDIDAIHFGNSRLFGVVMIMVEDYILESCGKEKS